MHDQAGAAPATVSESRDGPKPLCHAHGKAPPRQAPACAREPGDRPEALPGGPAVGGPDLVHGPRLPVVPLPLAAIGQFIHRMAVRGRAAEERTHMKKTLLAAALCGSTFAALAADATDPAALAPVIVTATRTAITVDDALSSVSVITREDIDRLQPVSLIDL